MVEQNIIWKDLPKRYGLFTRRNANMVDIKTGAITAYFSSNVKLNVVQETTYDNIRYFRTETAALRDLNLAVKASSFDLPPELASLEPSNSSLIDNLSSTSKTRTTEQNKKPSKNQEPLKSEEVVSEDRKQSIISAFKRFFRKVK